jgi:hypothetical protein
MDEPRFRIAVPAREKCAVDIAAVLGPDKIIK